MPFSTEEFLAVFAAYNTAVWPMQWILNGIAAATIVLVVSSVSNKERWVCALLSFLWAWMAIAYHVAQFARINPAAYLFSFVFFGRRRAAIAVRLAQGTDEVFPRRMV